MAVSTTNGFDGPYAANGVTTSFPFTFTAPSAGEVSVLLRDASGVESVASPSLYTVTLGAVSGGTVTFSVAPASGLFVIPYLDPAFTQEIAFEDGSAWRASPVNETADRSVARDQALKREVMRSLIVPMDEEGLQIPLAADRAEKALFFDAAGNVNPISVDDFAAPAAAQAGLAEGFTSILRNYTLGIDFATPELGVDPVTGVVDTRSFDVVADGRVKNYLNDGGTAVFRYELATVAYLATADGSDIGFSHASTYSAGTVGSALKAFIVASDAPWNVVGDDSTDNGAALVACIAYCAARGGGDILLPTGVIRTTATLDVTTSNVRLIGRGGDTSHGAGTAFTQKTVLKWTGSAGGTMLKMRTPYGVTAQRRYGMGLTNVELNGNSLAAIGVELDSIAYGEFSNVHVRHCTTAQYKLKTGVTGTDGPAGEALDLQLCKFSRMTFDARNTSYVATSAKGWIIDGSTNANVSGNVFELLNGIYSSGTAYDLIRADNNVFIRCSAFRSGGSGTIYTWTLTGSESSTGTGSYGNTFIQIGWDATYGFSFGASNGADSINTRVNTILGYDEANGGGAPEVGANSRVVCMSAKGVIEQSARVSINQLVADEDNGFSMTESANRHDFWASGNTLNYAGNGFAGTFKVTGNFDVVSAVGSYKVDGTKVIGVRKAGWATATGTANRTTFDTATITTAELAERVKALIDDLHATAGHGLIGA